MNVNKRGRYVAHAAVLFVESMLLAFVLGNGCFVPKTHYTKPGESLKVEFESGQTDLLKDIDHIILFCATKAEQNMFKSPKQATSVKLDGTGKATEYVLENVPADTFRFRFEFRFKKEVDYTDRWPAIKRMQFGDYDLNLEKLSKFFYEKGRRPSYECWKMSEYPFGGNIVKIICTGLILFAVICTCWILVLRHEQHICSVAISE